MADKRIKIEVDFDNAVAKIDELAVGFKEIGNTTVEARERILKMVSSTKVAAEGSVKALLREKGAWQEIQSSLSTTNAEYRAYQVNIDKIEAQIAKITDTRKREEIALKNSAAGIQQQIALIKEEQANRKLSNTQYRVMQKEIDALQTRYDALTNTKQRHQVVQKNSIADFDQQIAMLREEQRNTALSTEEIEKYEHQIEQVRIRKNALTGTTKGLDKASQSFSSSAGSAGATVTEFGRTIGDLPFGLIGITNNIQQLSQNFVDLQNKSGGTKGALEAIKATIMGPAGFVVAINIVTSALLYFTRQKENATKKAEDFNEALLLEKDSLIALNQLYKDGAENIENRARVMGALAAADEKYSEALDAIGVNEEKRAKLTKDYIRDRQLLNGAEEKRNQISTDQEDILKRQLMTDQEIADEYERIRNLTDPDGISIENSLLEAKIKKNDELKDVLGQLADATIDVDAAQKQLNETLGVSEIDKFLEKEKDFVKERQKTLALLGLEGSAAIQKEIDLLNNDYNEALEQYGVNSVQASEAKLALDKKRLDLEVALYDEEQDRIEKGAKKEKERNDKLDEEEEKRKDALAKLNKNYLDGLETQFDISGFKRLEQQERQAVAEAKALGASEETLLNIRKYYDGERKKIIDKSTREIEKKNEKKAEDAKKENKKKLEDFLQGEIDAMKDRVDLMSEVFSNFGNILDELGNISQSRFERQIGQLNEQRDIIRANDSLTKEEKEQQLTDLQTKENNIQRKRIKAERDMFTLKQAIVLAEMVMKQRAFVQEQIMMAQMTAALAKQAGTNIAITAAEETGEATMSIGTFMKELGPWGIAAFALSIGGVIASIVSARRKASAEIAGLSDAPVSVGGGGGGAAAPAAPSFNVVGASAQNQLAAAIAGQQSEPVRAYVVSSDVTTAQELDRKIVEGASI